MKKISKKIINAFAGNREVDELIAQKSKEVLKAGHKPLVFVASMPKAAGTFICKIIAEKHQLAYAHYTDRTGCGEFDIYHPALLAGIKDGGIVHQHTLGTEGNIYYLNKYDISTVVLTRNIYDALYSLYEHLEKYKNKWPIFEYPAGYFDGSFEKKISFIVNMLAPWFIRFYVSWFKAKQQGLINTVWLSYESFVDHKINLLNRIEKQLKIEPSSFITAADIDNVNREEWRFNKGITGRGVALIADEHKTVIQQMMSYYPEVDFGMIV
ncbi:MAG: hypothetical protein ABI861_11310 [Panacibacter sp.]